MDLIRVFIVDDMAQVRQDLRTVLPLAGEAAGLKIEIVGEAKDGQDALQLAQTLRPDVIIMDLAMPVLNGFEAARILKRCHPNVPIIALTVYNQADVGEKAAEAGIDYFIEKGEPIHTLIQIFARIHR